VITVRPIRAGDAEALARYVKPEPLLHEARAQLQRDERAVYLVAIDEDTPVGHALLKLPPLGTEHPRPAGIPEVEDLFVAASCRSNGIGSRLLQGAEEAARRRGFDRVGLAVAVRNMAARRFYDRAGYDDAGLGEFWIAGARETCRYLVKAL
jgi:ribosomal protein S18 acetylase RimI-like enzyme